MLDNVMRLREPAAWVVLAVTAASIVLALVRFGLALAAGEPLAAASQNVALQAMNLTLVIVVVALVWVCVFHQPTPGARRLSLTAAVIVTLGTLVTIVGGLLGLRASAGMLGMVLEFLGGLLDIILKLVGTATLWLIHRGLAHGRIAGEPDAAPQQADDVVAEVEPAAQGPAPSWTADAATGTVWTSAAEAAEGAAPSGHGVRGDGSGWHAVPRHEVAGRPADERALTGREDEVARLREQLLREDEPGPGASPRQ